MPHLVVRGFAVTMSKMSKLPCLIGSLRLHGVYYEAPQTSETQSPEVSWLSPERKPTTLDTEPEA